MIIVSSARRVVAAFVLLGSLIAPSMASAQTTPPRAGGMRLGVQGIATVGIGWPAASQSVDALGLDSKPVDVGGGVQVSGIWRDLFAQVVASRQSSSGERAFVDDEGNVFPLGIPLTVKSTYLDVSAGWKVAPQADSYQNVSSYVGAGLGVATLREASDFAQPGDDVDVSGTSYHVMGGIEVRLTSWLSVSGDVKYRWVPDLLGTDGVSSAFDEDDFGGFHAGVGLRIGVGGSRRPRLPAPDSTASAPVEPARPVAAAAPSETGTILSSAPVFLRPDETLQPLRTLSTGTSVKILQEDRDWIRIEFPDSLLGPRIGYILRKYIHIPQ